MRNFIFGLVVFLQSIAFAGEKSLLHSDIHVDAQQYQLQKMVTKPALHYKNPLKKLYEDPLLNFAAGIAVDYAINKHNEKSYNKNDVSNPRLTR